MWQGDVSLTDAFVISLTGMLVVMLELLVIALFIIIISGLIRIFHKPKPEKTQQQKRKIPKPVRVKTDAAQQNTKANGEITLEGLSEEETAVIMSAVSAECGLGLDKIEFKSIRKI